MKELQCRGKEEIKSNSLCIIGRQSAKLGWFGQLYKNRSEVYAIVGFDQTSSSKCLTKMTFPAKIVSLLGKEKEGSLI